MLSSFRSRILSAGLGLVLIVTGEPLCAQSPTASTSPQAVAVLQMLHQQEADWNRGDLDTFATGYKDSPDILFIGRTIHRGYAEMLATYHKAFPTRAAMGTLSFSDLEVQPLDARFATVTGRFHLERTAAGGGEASGYYLLVVEKTPSGWKIVRDDSTNDPPQR